LAEAVYLCIIKRVKKQHVKPLNYDDYEKNNDDYDDRYHDSSISKRNEL
jgi:hypothetical protein